MIDGRTGYLGGTGIADDWMGDGRTHGRWRDSHYCLRGPAVAQMQQAFMDNWLETRAELLHGDEYFQNWNPRARICVRSLKVQPAKAQIAGV